MRAAYDTHCLNVLQRPKEAGTMMELAIIVLALVAVYAIKAVAIAKGHETLAANDASFSWAHMRAEDAQTAEEWTHEQPVAERQPRVALGTSPVMRHVGA